MTDTTELAADAEWPVITLPGTVPEAALQARREAVLAELHEEKFAHTLADEIVRQRARREAKRILDAEERAEDDFEVPDPTTLADLLDEEDEVTEWRVTGVWPRGGNILLSAGAKAGKTTTTGNIIRSLVDGDRLFRIYPVEQAVTDGAVALLDFEMPRKSVKKWLREQGVRNRKAVAIWTQRGKAQCCDLRDRDVRAKWVAKLQKANVKVWIIDCLSPLLSALGIPENDNTEVGRVLDGITAAATEAGVEEVLLIHHMGHSAERSRGASRLIGWPDVNFRILRKRDENNPGAEPEPDSPRYFSAYGRDVDVREGRLLYDEATRHLTYIEGGRKASEHAAGMGRLLVFVRDNPDLSGDAIQKKLVSLGVGRNETRSLLKEAKTKGYITEQAGKAGAKLHRITGPGRTALQVLSENPPTNDEVDSQWDAPEVHCECGIYISPPEVASGYDRCKWCREGVPQ